MMMSKLDPWGAAVAKKLVTMAWTLLLLGSSVAEAAHVVTLGDVAPGITVRDSCELSAEEGYRLASEAYDLPRLRIPEGTVGRFFPVPGLSAKQQDNSLGWLYRLPQGGLLVSRTEMNEDGTLCFLYLDLPSETGESLRLLPMPPEDQSSKEVLKAMGMVAKHQRKLCARWHRIDREATARGAPPVFTPAFFKHCPNGVGVNRPDTILAQVNLDGKRLRIVMGGTMVVLIGPKP